MDQPLARGAIQELYGDATHFIGRFSRLRLLERGTELGTLCAIADLRGAGLPKVLLGGIDVRHGATALGFGKWALGRSDLTVESPEPKAFFWKDGSYPPNRVYVKVEL